MDINETHVTDQDKSESSRPSILRAVIGFTIYILLSPVLLFVSAGTLDWPMAWLYVTLLLVSIIGSRLISLWLHPDLLRERAAIASGEGAAAWDKLLVWMAARFRSRRPVRGCLHDLPGIWSFRVGDGRQPLLLSGGPHSEG